MISAVKLAVVIPAVIGGLWMARNEEAASRGDFGYKVAFRSQPSLGFSAALAESEAPDTWNQEAIAVVRRIRVERLVENLESLSSIAKQMSPERAAQVELVLEDMTDQCAELVSESALKEKSTDEKIARIEKSLGRLIISFAKVLEPELSL